jgi:hypothetical protein
LLSVDQTSAVCSAARSTPTSATPSPLKPAATPFRLSPEPGTVTARARGCLRARPARS